MLGMKLGRDALSLANAFWHDYLRVLRYSSAVCTGDTQGKLAALITMGYHGIEKGLALPQPRPGFGKPEVSLLISRLERYGMAFGFDETAIVAFNVLGEYCRFNEEHGALDPEFLPQIKSLARFVASQSVRVSAGGGKLVVKEDFLKRARIDLKGFFESRSSVRQYASQPVALEDMETAVNLARRTPSCCNRQSGRVWVLRDQPSIQKALEIQGGARGFGQEVPAVLVITSDLACFQSAGERGQALIDGGMFAMSVVYALHSLGLVTCCLNWSKTHATDTRLRQLFPIPMQETIIMLVAVGHPKDRYLVAESHRRDVGEVMRVL